jgi:Phosphodiester glycosidase
MLPAPPPRRRRLLCATAGVVAAASVMVPGVAIARPTTPGYYRPPASCPGAESLVSGTRFASVTLAPGIVERVGTATDDQGRGQVVIHVLRVNLALNTTSVQPLMRHLAHVAPLSSMAAGHPRLVAATNTGYFDMFASGAPTLPLIAGGGPLILSRNPAPVVGFTADHRIESGTVWLTGKVAVGRGQARKTATVTSVNDYAPPAGLAIYTAKWGSSGVPVVDEGDYSRPVVRGVLGSASSNPDQVPSGGALLVANGSGARSWLSGLPSGANVTTSLAVGATAAAPFTQAYGVGVTLVAKRGVAKTGFACRRSNPQPARTTIGLTNHGKTMVIAFVSDHPQTSEHGLDNDQMSALMVQLGVDQAYNFDGSGSTELLAKLPGRTSLSLQTYPADGDERLMPLGLGIAYTPPAKVKAKPNR